MNGIKGCSFLTASIVLALSISQSASARNGQPNPTPTPPPNAPPAPTLVAPAVGVSLVQPITLDWNATSNPNGPIGSYTWQISTTSTFTTVIASGFTNMDSDPSVPTATA